MLAQRMGKNSPGDKDLFGRSFAVPVDAMFAASAIGKGIVLALGPACLTKLVAGLFASMRYSSPAARARAR